MSGDEAITLQTYIDTLFKAHEREHELLREALNKAEATLCSRLEGMNEFRAQLNRQSETFATKDMLSPLQRFQDKSLATVVGFGLGFTVVNGIVTTLIMLLLAK